MTLPAPTAARPAAARPAAARPAAARPCPAGAARGYANGPAEHAVHALLRQLDDQLAGRSPRVVMYFASTVYEPGDVAVPITAHFPDACVLGCSTAGEFTDQVTATGGISAVVLHDGIIGRAAAAVADLADDPVGGTQRMIASIERQLGVRLRDLDRSRHVGLVLIDGLHGVEEAVGEQIGRAAPTLDVVGGSAGDDLVFDHTWVAVGDRISECGVALVVCEATVPFRVIKTCSFHPAGQVLQVTRVDARRRTVLEFDRRPAAAAYAAALGVHPECLDSTVLLAHPLGLMIDGHTWIRSPEAITPEGHMRFYAQVLEGMCVALMDPGDLVADTAVSFGEARAELGGQVSGAVLFNCVLRRLELDARRAADDFVRAFDGLPLAGFHSYGQTWLGHVNQTLTGVVFG